MQYLSAVCIYVHRMHIPSLESGVTFRMSPSASANSALATGMPWRPLLMMATRTAFSCTSRAATRSSFPGPHPCSGDPLHHRCRAAILLLPEQATAMDRRACMTAPARYLCHVSP